MTRRSRILGMLLLGGVCLQQGAPARAAESVPPAASSLSATNPPATASTGAAQADEVAGRFAVMCAGCHSLSGVQLNGPELTPATRWPLDQLKPAIKRMEKNVGPLTEEQVSALAEFLKSPNARERVKAEQERLQSQFTARLAPADPVIGQRLFEGTEPLRNGGMACAACHAVNGVGGNLGLDLTGVFARVGGMTPLVSGIEQAGYKIMAPHYRRHPIAKQEAMHLAKYLSSVTPIAAVAAPFPLVPVGGGAAAALLAALVAYLRRQRQNRGREARLRPRRK